MVDEKIEAKGTQTVGAEKDTGEGDKPEASQEIERINAETERLNKAIAENENAKARAKLGGVSLGYQEQEKPKELGPEEYSKLALQGKLPEK